MKNQTVLITGCSAGGIGHELVLSFQRRGYTVFATARSLKKMADLASLPNVHLLELDVTNPDSITATAKEIDQRTSGRLDVLINNAGQQYIMPALDVDIAAAKALFEVNYWAPLRMIQAFSSMLIDARGCVVNIGSGSGVVSIPFQSQYNASKAAINMLSETLRYELAPLNVRVITLVAGNVASNMSSGVNGAPPAELPATSRYKAVEKTIAAPVEFSEMGTAKFADGVVEAVRARATGKVWRGGNMGIVRWVVPIMPGFIYDRIMISLGRGLDKMPKVK
ncbi:short chain dehydrogenase [Stagonosporopsis vannaccii]|nr:short chain dehydrogenase [Stagonosporopsis vannaccii]